MFCIYEVKIVRKVCTRKKSETPIWPLGDGVLAEGGAGNEPGARSKQPPAYLQSTLVKATTPAKGV